MVVPRYDEVVHGRRAMGYVDVLVADLLGEGHDVHDVLVSTLRCFLYDLSVMKKKLVVAQGC